MKVIIAGSRTFNNYGYFKEKMLEVQKQIADWEKYGNAAGYIRNVKMAQAADFLVAFWDGKSKGTKHMIDNKKKQGKHGIVFISG